jgi:adenosylmethionine-8-amino-7-oxononanoate aminotransferase
MGPVLHRLLADLGEQHPSIGEVRSIGLFGVIELVRDRHTRQPMAPFNGTSPEMTALRKYMLDNGLYIYTMAYRSSSSHPDHQPRAIERSLKSLIKPSDNG